MPTRNVVVVVAALLIGGAAFFYAREARLGGIADERVRVAREQETIAVRAYKVAHDSIPMLQDAYVRAERTIRNLRTVAAGTMVRAETVTVASSAVLADTSATAPELRAALASQILVTSQVSDMFQAYVNADIQSDSSAEALIATQRSVILKADTALAAAQRVSNAYKSRECKILFLKCPSRLQSAIVGGLVGGYLVVRATR